MSDKEKKLDNLLDPQTRGNGGGAAGSASSQALRFRKNPQSLGTQDTIQAQRIQNALLGPEGFVNQAADSPHVLGKKTTIATGGPATHHLRSGSGALGASGSGALVPPPPTLMMDDKEQQRDNKNKQSEEDGQEEARKVEIAPSGKAHAISGFKLEQQQQPQRSSESAAAVVVDDKDLDF